MGLLAIIGVILFFLLGSYLFSTLIEEKDKIYSTNESITPKEIALALGKIIGLLALFISVNYFLLVKVNVRYIGILVSAVLFIIMMLALLRKELKLDMKKFSMISSGLVGSLVVIIVILYGIFGGRVYFHANAYSELLELDEGEFNNDVQTVDVSTLPIVDKSYGEKLGTLKLGEYPGIGSEFEAGEYSDIIFDNEQYMVAPLEYRGIFKWFNNNDQGTPGYILINKVTAETRLINIKESEGKGLKYTPSAYLGQDLVRHAYFDGMHKYNLEDVFFEIDEDMHPYYVLQYSLPTIFINGGKDIAKIAVVDAVTGETMSYDPDEIPDWVESVYPPSLVLTQLNYWGSLQDGWLNSFLAQRGVLRASNGKRTVKNGDGLFYFTGLTSAGSDESTIGFVYINTRTKETNLYNFPGATENAAMNKAMTLIPQNNISTSFPIPINVNDSPTYYILIKGEDGRIIRQVFMNVQDLELSGIAEKKTNAYNEYLLNLGGSNQSNLETLTGVILNIEAYVSEGNTIYWVELDNNELYLINVSSFDIADMRYFMAKDIGDEITFKVQEYTILDFVAE
jgi:hypothetical protein